MRDVLALMQHSLRALTSIAEQGDEIDELRAKQALERALQRQKEAKSRIDAKRADAAIARAKARLKAKLNETN